MNVSDKVRAPELPETLDWFNTDRPMRLEALRDRIVLLWFFTASSVNSRHALADLHALQDRYENVLSIIGVYTPRFENERNPQQVQKAVDRLQVRFPVVHDPQFLVWRAYGIKAWPSFIFIDPQGGVVGVLRGEGRRDQLDKLIQEHRPDARPGLVQTAMPSKPPESRGALYFPTKVIANRSSLFVADSGHNRIVETYHDGRIRRVFGGGSAALLDGMETAAAFNAPHGMVVVDDFVYVADTGNHAIRRIHLKTGEVMTLAGNGEQGRYAGLSFRDASDAKLNSPVGVAYHESNLYITMTGQHQVWRLNLNHMGIERYAGTGRGDLIDGALDQAAFAQPSGIVFHEGTLYVADAESSSLRAIDPQRGRVTTLVGKGLFNFGDREGPGDKARLQYPLGITADGERNTLWIADTYNSRIKRMDIASREVTKFRISYALDEPGGLCLYRNKLFIANTNAHQIVVLDLKSRMSEVVNIRAS